MTDIKIAVRGNQIALLRPVDLIAGTVGQKCNLYFDDTWAAYNKTVSYKVGTTIVGSYEIKSNTFIIPAQVLAMADLPLEIGVTGRSTDNSIVVPTHWCLIGIIKNSAVSCSNNSIQNDEIIYDGGGVSSNSKNKAIYEGGGI